jgi:hypothetical protein
MSGRFVLYSKDPLKTGAKELRQARAVLRDLGVSVVAVGVGSLLIEGAPVAAQKAARALPGWSVAAETADTRKPEGRRLKVRAVAER